MATRRNHKVAGAAQERGDARRNGLSAAGAERMLEIQRARILAAMVGVACEQGLAGATVAQVVARAGVSRRTFYELFDDREDCFLAALDEGVARIAERVLPAYERPGRWRERIRASLIELLSFLDSDPGTGRLVIVETLGAGREVLRHRGNVLAQIIAAVDEGRAEGKAGIEAPPLAAEGVVGAVLSVIHGRLVEGDRRQPLFELTGPLMSMIVLPFLGPSAARRELERPVPVIASKAEDTSARDPLKELPIRLTYRTVRVLLAVGSHPGASNREIGLVSGAEDQGQISKLLSRLEKLGLVSNTGLGPGRGAPNAWTLTSAGREVERALTSPRAPSGASSA